LGKSEIELQLEERKRRLGLGAAPSYEAGESDKDEFSANM
jgi:hypothetical protein